jgi:predicted transcriptional regulator of viral defense system
MSTRRYAALSRLGVRTITTAAAAAAWKTSVSDASRDLAEMADSGLVEHLRRGVWLLDLAATPESLAGEVTAPYPSYVSHLSALYVHGVILQVPADVHLAVSSAPRHIDSSRGGFVLHRMPVSLFGGTSALRGADVAGVEKALFDWAYLSTAAGLPNARLPETDWPASFRWSVVDMWMNRISSQRLRTMTAALAARRGPRRP